MDKRRLNRRDRNTLTILFVSIIIVSIIGVLSLPGLLSTEETYRFYRNPSFSFPNSFNKSKPHNYERDHLADGISTEILGYTEFHFFEDFSGGMTGSRMVIYNKFSHPKKNVAIIHHFYIIGLYEYQLIKQNRFGEWVESSVHYSWSHPNDSMLFSGMDDYFNNPIVCGNLIVGDTLNGSGYSWLDLGEIYIGGSDHPIEGYNFLTISYGNSQAYETYHNEENVLYNNYFAVKKLKQFIIRDDISWQISNGEGFGWQTINRKTYYLGNNAIEGTEGYENVSGIVLSPYSSISKF